MDEQFIAIDVETANHSRASICQIALVARTAAGVSWEWSSLVNPECDFDSCNVGVHGIGSQKVATAPTWPRVLLAISESIRNQVLVCHSRFDGEAFHQACARYDLAFPECIWLDTCDIAKACWPQFANHDLATLCRKLSITIQHHDALSDAHACGAVLASAFAQTGLGLADWITRASFVTTPSLASEKVSARYSERIEARGDPAGPLTGQVWVCTGEFVRGKPSLFEWPFLWVAT